MMPRRKNLQPLVLSFLDTLAFRSGHTVSNYGRTLQDFARFAEFQTDIQDWSEANADTIRGYIVWRRKEAKVTGRTIARDLSVMRMFFEYLIDEDVATGNPTKGIRPPKHEKKLPTPLEIEQVDSLLSFECESPMDYRDKAMFELLYSSGLRVSELCRLNLENVDLDDQMIRVIRGKGGYDRDVPFGKKAKAAILEWLERREARDGETALFVSQRGERPSTRTVQARLKKHSGTQLGFHVHPHILRHSCATHFLRASGDIRATQELLGHTDIGNTAIYTHLDMGHAASVLKRHHPRAYMCMDNTPREEAESD